MKTYQVRYRSETLGVKELGGSVEPVTFRALYFESPDRSACVEKAHELRRSIATGSMDPRSKVLMFDSVSVE